ncbi:phage minor structural protein [Desulfofarcimen acetoxidans DSM 771]|uniref:Phage minor structural protein n=1 Tax=Desulfofarcimen acetoxidans (strain ATCC 49208 / DSM 771 / KCTC 5769 / VKM B-1644 / 5575) TaxID=485916 RepID=C8VXP0_DESAS|nr:phage tail protein [Desulfofarcimen acetoxidans]ACV62696.1 phage minor structural protein [Desulfofarcimen acetoxidans DSM 771]
MLYLFDSAEKLLAIYSQENATCPYYDAVHTEKLTGENTFIFTIPADHQDSRYITEGNLVGFKDPYKDWQLFEIKRITDIHGEGLTRTAYCEHVLYELIDDFIEDIRPTDCTALIALIKALEGTRWEPGVVDDLGVNSTNFYYESALSAVQKVAAIWKGELRFRVVISNNAITKRYVDLLARRGAVTGKQFTYDRNTSQIEREVDLTSVVTALYGRGKGVEVGDGYGRRLDFSGIGWAVANGNPADKPLSQRWIGDAQALAQWGRAGRHRFGVFEDSEETDPAVLLQKTWDTLQERKMPRVTYSLDVVDLESLSGYGHEKVRLGDTVRVIDRKFNLEILVEARILEINRNLLKPEDTEITLGNFTPSITDEALKQMEINRAVNDKQGVWDRASQFNADGTLSAGKLTDTLVGLDHTLQLASEAVTEAKIAVGAISTPKLATNAVTADKLAPGTINEAKMNWKTHLLY